MNALTDAELQHLLAFVGYGHLNAKVWFIGMEEGGGGEANLRARLKFKPVEDCAKAHEILGITRLHGPQPRIQRTWRGMCYLMLRLAGQTPNAENIRRYQADHLGRTHGDTLLCELMPLPKPSLGHWDYAQLIPQYPNAEHYYQTVMPARINLLQSLLQTHQPKIVIAYGKRYWENYKQLFPALNLTATGQFEIAQTAEQVVVLTDHFTARTMNGKLDEVALLIEKGV